MIIATTGQKGRKPPIEEATDNFEKLLEAPCLNHHYPVWHAYRDCVLLRKSISKGTSPEKEVEPQQNREHGKGGCFPQRD